MRQSDRASGPDRGWPNSQTSSDIQVGRTSNIRGATSRPAIGLDVTDRTDDTDAIINTVTDVQQYNSHVIAVADATDKRLLSRLRSLDITIAEITDPAHTDPEHGLIVAAKDLGLPGVLIHPAPEQSADIEYHKSCDEFRTANQYAIPAHIAEHKSDAAVIAGLTAVPQSGHSEQLVRAVSDYVDDVLIVDHDTRDATPQVIHDADANVIDYDPNNSTATPIQRLFQHVERHYDDFDAFVLLGEIDQVPPAAIPALIGPVSEEDADIVIGRRAATDDQSDTQDVRPIGQRLRDSFTMGSPERRDADLQLEVQALSADAVSQLKDYAGSIDSATGLIDTAIRANLTVREHELETQFDVDVIERESSSSAVTPHGSAGAEQTPPTASDTTWNLSQEAPARTDRPAVGLAVTPGMDSDAVAGAVLRADRAGHDVLIGAVTATDTETVAFTDALGAHIIDIQGRGPDAADPRTVLANAAREAGYPGLLWQTDPEQRINFTQSVAALTDAATYSDTPIEQPTVEPQPHVLVAIPAYNEADTIADVVRDAQPHADEVLVVDDGSDDETAERAREAGATVIEHASNKGYGATLKTAFREADRTNAAHLVILDGDGQHDPSEIPRLIHTQREQDAEIVTGSRFENGAKTDLPVYRRFGLAVVNFVTNISLGVIRPSSRVKDTQCGFRAYNIQATESIAADSSIGSHMGASTDILHHAHKHDYQIEEVPTAVDYTVENGSTRNPVRHGITLIMNLVRTIEEDRPITAIGVPGFVSVLIGMGFAYWTVANYLQSSTFPLGLAVTSTLFLLGGTFACFAAIILHSLNTHLSEK